MKKINKDATMITVETIMKNPATGETISFKGDSIENVKTQIDKQFGPEE